MNSPANPQAKRHIGQILIDQGILTEDQLRIALLEQTHRTLRAAVADLRPADLNRKPPRSKVTMRALVTGVAAHDLYHAGQIQLLKRLAQP